VLQAKKLRVETAMLVKVNKKIATRPPVKYAALSTGTISHVWYDDDSVSANSPKRKNRIRLMIEPSDRVLAYDA